MGITTSSMMCACLSREQKDQLEEGQAVWAGDVQKIIEVPVGAAAGMYSYDFARLVNSQPAALSKILDDNNAQETYKEFVNAVASVPKGLFGQMDGKETFATYEPFVEKFQACNIGLHCCYRITGGGKNSRRWLWFVYVDLAKLPEYTPAYKWSGEYACAIM
mmetsp:Transcript_125991/g.223231  ORF Transcript_125991/g.223231 Transcript_125991/m.223231 type:complete len:162 (+) Transcript_125991:68-553(+)